MRLTSERPKAVNIEVVVLLRNLGVKDDISKIKP